MRIAIVAESFLPTVKEATDKLALSAQYNKLASKANQFGLAKGDEVITAGGMTGKITKVTDDFITVSIAENVEVQFQKSAISTVLPKGTLKN